MQYLDRLGCRQDDYSNGGGVWNRSVQKLLPLFSPNAACLLLSQSLGIWSKDCWWYFGWCGSAVRHWLDSVPLASALMRFPDSFGGEIPSLHAKFWVTVLLAESLKELLCFIVTLQSIKFVQFCVQLCCWLEQCRKCQRIAHLQSFRNRGCSFSLLAFHSQIPIFPHLWILSEG